MHWAEEQVNPMLALRNIICSDRWKEEWPKIETRLRQQTRQRKCRLHQARIIIPKPTPTSRSSPNMDTKFMQALATKIQQQYLSKKPNANPWRNFKHGKALYQRTNPPKK